jgi:hypothetical protein
MAYELDSEMRLRLQKHYRDVSDQELLNAVVRLDDLTPTAQEVVHAELGSRGMQRAWPGGSGTPAAETATGWMADPFGTSQPEPMPKPEFGTPLERGKVALVTLYDAIEAGQACDALDAERIVLDVRDLSEKAGRGSFYGGAPIALQLIVSERDRDAAVKVLREKMGLFPLEEIAEPDTMVDDGTVATVGQFARRADAQDVVRALDEARIWNRITANEEGSAETEDAFLVEVREIDLMKAGEMVEKALGLPEG